MQKKKFPSKSCLILVQNNIKYHRLLLLDSAYSTGLLLVNKDMLTELASAQSNCNNLCREKTNISTIIICSTIVYLMKTSSNPCSMYPRYNTIQAKKKIVILYPVVQDTLRFV